MTAAGQKSLLVKGTLFLLPCHRWEGGLFGLGVDGGFVEGEVFFDDFLEACRRPFPYAFDGDLEYVFVYIAPVVVARLGLGLRLVAGLEKVWFRDEDDALNSDEELQECALLGHPSRTLPSPKETQTHFAA